MKRHIYFLCFTAAIAISACKKDHNPNPSVKSSTGKHALTFAINQFSQQSTPITTQSSNHIVLNSVTSDPNDVRAAFDTIFLFVADASGHLLHTRSFSVKTYTTTSIKDSLVAGTYKIALYAGKHGFNGSSYGKQVASFPSFDLANPWDDTYAASFTVTVGNNDITQGVTIQRIVAKLNVVITDAIPSGAGKFTMNIDHDYALIGDTFSALPDTVEQYFQPATFNPLQFNASTHVGTTNFTMSYITFNTVKPITITLTCFNGNTAIAQRTLGPVTLSKNENLTFSGKFFGGPSTHNNWQVGIDTAWKTPITKTF